MCPWTWGCGPQLEDGDPVLNEIDSLEWVTTVPVAYVFHCSERRIFMQQDGIDTVWWSSKSDYVIIR
jgi:hypothetical protein